MPALAAARKVLKGDDILLLFLLWLIDTPF